MRAFCTLLTILFLLPAVCFAANHIVTTRDLERQAQEGKSAAWGLLSAKAAQGDADAQMHIGRMYEFGHGVGQDYVEAYFWDSLAMQYPSYRFVHRQADGVAKHLTPEQILAVKKRVEGWTPALAAVNPHAKPENIKSIAGVYKYAFDNGDVNGNKYRSENILEIVEYSQDSAYFRTHLEFYNGHQCGLWGIAKIEGGALVYRGSGSGARGLAGLTSVYDRCVLHLNISADSISLNDENGVCRMTSCGARGDYGVSFSRSKRQKIHYMQSLQASPEYEDAVKESQTLHDTETAPARR